MNRLGVAGDQRRVGLVDVDRRPARTLDGPCQSRVVPVPVCQEDTVDIGEPEPAATQSPGQALPSR